MSRNIFGALAIVVVTQGACRSSSRAIGGSGGGGALGSGGSAGAGAGTGGATGAPRDGGPSADGAGGAVATGIVRFQDPPPPQLDLLFMVDDSQSMAPLQAKLVQQFPGFITVLTALSGGPLDLHIAVISSSLGAGIFTNVPGCSPGSQGNDLGAFQHRAQCTGLHPGERFISSVNGVNNFDGDIASVFACIATLGDGGCGFEHQFASTMTALQKANAENVGQPVDPDNGGFLRPNATLAIVMLTNEDDCSAPPDSRLFDTGVISVDDPAGLGGLQSYRCNEFGHLCDPAATPPPHLPPAAGSTVTLTGCTSAEGMSPRGGAADQLITVQSFVDFLRGLKPDPNKLLVAALAGPPTPYVVGSHTFQLPNGTTELQPLVQHSCTSGTAGTEYADPAVRIQNWLYTFGTKASFESICDADFTLALNPIATNMAKANCVGVDALAGLGASPVCTIQVAPGDSGTAADVSLPACNGTRSVVPCWELRQDPVCGDGQRFVLCRDATCAPPTPSTSGGTLNVTCARAR